MTFEQSNPEVPRLPSENLAKKAFSPPLVAPDSWSVKPCPAYRRIRGILRIENNTNIQKNAFIVIKNKVGPSPISLAVGVTHLDFLTHLFKHGM